MPSGSGERQPLVREGRNGACTPNCTLTPQCTPQSSLSAPTPQRVELGEPVVAASSAADKV